MSEGKAGIKQDVLAHNTVTNEEYKVLDAHQHLLTGELLDLTIEVNGEPERIPSDDLEYYYIVYRSKGEF